MKSYATSPELLLLHDRALALSKVQRDSFEGGLKPTHRISLEEIQHRAYAIWQREGEPRDRDLAHWLRAEVEVMHEL